jgi:hypothetical protein
MKAVVPANIEQSIATDDTLRVIVDTPPALIHTGQADGYVEYFSRAWLQSAIATL